jgi:hypothetical protein
MESANSPEESKSEWSLSQERAFMEDLVQKRFHFLLLVLFFVVAGALAATSQTRLKLILTAGLVIFALVSATVFRAYVKLDELLKILHQDESHPISILQKRIKARRCGLFGVQWMIGALIPGLITLCLLFVTALVWMGCLKINGDKEFERCKRHFLCHSESGDGLTTYFTKLSIGPIGMLHAPPKQVLEIREPGTLVALLHAGEPFAGK